MVTQTAKRLAKARREAFVTIPTRRNRVWQTDFFELETRRRRHLRSGDVIDYATKLVLAGPVTATQTTRDAIAASEDAPTAGARGFPLPAPTRVGSPNEPELLGDTAQERRRAGLHPRDVAVDGGFAPGAVAEQLPDATKVFISGRQSTGSRHTDRRLARYRVGAEGRISHLKRGYGMRRTRLRGIDGARTTVGWSILTYNLDTLAIRTT